MAIITTHCLLIFIHLGLSLCSGSDHEANKPAVSKTISSRQMDVTTPVTTIPILNPTPSTTPVLNPAISNPDSPTITNNPITTPTTTSSPVTGSSWCVASPSASQSVLQVALDYACGYGGADCSAIQPTGACYSPNTLRDHASYAFNSYYQKNPVPTSCSFGGTAVTSSTNPSSGACQYPLISTSSSVLNISNTNGATVFGAGPANPSSSKAALPTGTRPLFIYPAILFVIMMLPANYYQMT